MLEAWRLQASILEARGLEAAGEQAECRRRILEAWREEGRREEAEVGLNGTFTRSTAQGEVGGY